MISPITPPPASHPRVPMNSPEDGTAAGTAAMPFDGPPRRPTLHVQVPSATSLPDEDTFNEKMDPVRLAPVAPDSQTLFTPSEEREVSNRLNDDLQLLRAERMVSDQDANEAATHHSRARNKSSEDPLEDTFNTATAQPVIVSTPAKETRLTRLWTRIKKFPRVLRYVVYALPGAILILIPIFLALFGNVDGTVGGEGGVRLLWFGIWLEILWCSLWLGRLLTAVMPFIFSSVADAFGSSNPNKWRDLGRQLEFSVTLFAWQLVLITTSRPILNGNRVPTPGEKGAQKDLEWLTVVYKIIIAFFTLAALNLVEKVLIQWIAASFHVRTYSHRIHDSRMQTDFLVTLYTYARTQLEDQDPVWGDSPGHGRSGLASGARTPMKAIQENAKQAWHKVGLAANRMAGDFTGRQVLKPNHPRKVVLELLRSTATSQTLARVFYRVFVKPDHQTIFVDDLLPAFPSAEDAEVCFAVFDRDLNGDISMEELEMVCNEVHLEKKAIAASLKDLDSVINRLDHVLMFLIVVIVIIVFISIISNSAAAALTSTGTFILGLSWLLQATAQEFLQSIIFVFVKHPFDVGDRVKVYGNVGTDGRSDDYYVQEISLLYTEFKKMDGSVVQAPNSILNTLFILNQRRSGALADPITLILRFGTSEDQIEELKARMRDFCLEHKRDYSSTVLSETTTINNVNNISVNIIFFHKGNFQNELLRLQRHGKLVNELMRHMREMGIDGPAVHVPGGARDMPFFYAHVPPPTLPPAYSRGAATGYNDGGASERANPASSVTAGGVPPAGDVGAAAAAAASRERGPFGPWMMQNQQMSIQAQPPSSNNQSHQSIPFSMNNGFPTNSTLPGTNGGGGGGGGTDSPVIPFPAFRSHRADSRAAVQDPGLDFQDVYTSRRNNEAGGPGLARLASHRRPAATTTNNNNRQRSGSSTMVVGGGLGSSSGIDTLSRRLRKIESGGSESTGRVTIAGRSSNAGGGGGEGSGGGGGGTEVSGEGDNNSASTRRSRRRGPMGWAARSRSRSSAVPEGDNRV